MAVVNRPFRYQAIAEDLRKRIGGGEFSPGSRMPTDAQTAEHYSVNRLTLRKAIDILETEGLVERQRGRVTVRSKPRPSAVKDLVFVGETGVHVMDEFYLQLTRHIQMLGGTLRTVSVPERGDFIDDAWLASIENCSGMIVDGSRYDQLADWLTKTDLPFVVVGVHHDCHQTTQPHYQLFCDRVAGGRLVVDHLRELGHRRFGYIGTPADFTDLSSRANEHDPVLHGVRQGLGEHEGCELRTLGFYMGQALREELYPSVREMVTWASAIVCDFDYRATHILRLMLDDGLRVPQDRSLVGAGNTPWSQAAHPRLTTVSFQEAETARLAVQLLQSERPSAKVRLRMEPLLIQGASVQERQEPEK